MAVLPGAQQVSGPADFQIPHGYFKTAAQLCKFLYGRQTFFCHFLQHFILPVHEKSIGCPAGTPHPAPKLVKLRQAHVVRILNNHGIDVGNIKSCFNNCGRYQYINFSVDKLVHDIFQLPLLHLAMGKGHVRLRHQPGNPGSHFHNLIHPVEHIIHLPFPGQLPIDGFPHNFFIIFHHVSLYGHTVHGRLLQHAHVPDANQAHMEGPGNRGGRQGKHIHIFLHLLDFFFMSHAKPLLLVNNQKTQILKYHVFGKYPVGANHNIHHAPLQILCGLFHLAGRTEPAHQIHPHREVLHPLDKVIVMLLGQNRGGHQVYHLFSILNGFKCRPDGNFRFSVAHVSADQPVHDFPAFHITFGSLNGQLLVFGFIKGKQLFKFFLPYRVFSIGKAIRLLAHRVQFHQFFRNFLHRAFHPASGPAPFLSVQPVDFRLFGLCACILLNGFQLSGQYIQGAPLIIFDFHIIFGDFLNLHFLNSPVDSYAIALMYHIIPDTQIRKALNFFSFVHSALFPALLFPAENIAFRNHHEFNVRILKAFFELSVRSHHLSWLHRMIIILAVKAVQPGLLQVLRQMSGTGSGTGQQDHLIPVFPVLL